MNYLGVIDFLREGTIVSTILIAIIFVVRKLIKKNVNPRFIYYLWFIVIIKLMIPYGPESSISIYNIFNNEKTVANKNINSYIESQSTEMSIPTVNDRYEQATNTEIKVVPKEEIINSTNLKLNEFNQFRLMGLMFFIWIIGVVTLMFNYSISYSRLMSGINKNHKELPEDISVILEDTLKIVGVRRKIRAVITEKVSTPSLTGVIKPSIVIPSKLVNSLSKEEVRYIFLHELCHLKRGDILISWMASIVRTIYWFNPFVYLAFKAMSKDCELACDNMVLSYIDKNENISYGNTIINVLAFMGKTKLLPGITTMVQSKSTIKDRIKAISKNKSFTVKSIILGILIITSLAVIGLTSKKDSSFEKFFTEAMKKMHYGETDYKYSIIYTDMNVIKNNDAIAVFLEPRTNEDVVFIAYFEKLNNKWEWKQTRGNSINSPINFNTMSQNNHIIYSKVFNSSEIEKITVGNEKGKIISVNDKLSLWFAISKKLKSYIDITSEDGTKAAVGEIPINNTKINFNVINDNEIELTEKYSKKIGDFYNEKGIVLAGNLAFISSKEYGYGTLVLVKRRSEGLLDLFMVDNDSNVIAWATGYAAINTDGYVNTLSFDEDKIVFGEIKETLESGFIEVVSKDSDLNNIKVKNSNFTVVEALSKYIDNGKNLTTTSFSIVKVNHADDFIELSKLNGDVVDFHGDISNYNNLLSFIDIYNKGVNGELKVVSYTMEGDPIIYTVRNVGKKLDIYVDNSYDRFSVEKSKYYTASNIVIKKEARESNNFINYYLERDGSNEPLLLLSYKEN